MDREQEISRVQQSYLHYVPSRPVSSWLFGYCWMDGWMAFQTRKVSSQLGGGSKDWVSRAIGSQVFAVPKMGNWVIGYLFTILLHHLSAVGYVKG